MTNTPSYIRAKNRLTLRLNAKSNTNRKGLKMNDREKRMYEKTHQWFNEKPQRPIAKFLTDTIDEELDRSVAQMDPFNLDAMKKEMNEVFKKNFFEELEKAAKLDAIKRQAILDSIACWEEKLSLARQGKYSEIKLGGDNCPLCKLFCHGKYYEHCDDCPVFKKTGLHGCDGTPFTEVKMAMGRIKLGVNVYFVELPQRIEEEIRFLRSLLDEPKFGTWYKPSEKEPPVGTKILGYIFFHDRFVIIGQECLDENHMTISHWTPLPEPPKADEIKDINRLKMY